MCNAGTGFCLCTCVCECVSLLNQVRLHQGHHLSSGPEAKTTCCQHWWFVLQHLCGLGSEVTSHRQSGVNGACVTPDKRPRAPEQSRGRRNVLLYVCTPQYSCLISSSLSYCNRINSCLFPSFWPSSWSLYPYFSSRLHTSPKNQHDIFFILN